MFVRHSQFEERQARLVGASSPPAVRTVRMEGTPCIDILSIGIDCTCAVQLSMLAGEPVCRQPCTMLDCLPACRNVSQDECPSSVEFTAKILPTHA